MQARYRRTLSALVATAVIAVSFGVGPSAQAKDTNPAVDDRLQQLLANNPGARVAGPDSIVMPQGMTLSLGSAKASAVPETLCSYEHLCLFEHADFKGEKLTFGSDCNLYPIWQLKMANGKFWGADVSSYINNQKAGTWAFMWNNYGAVDTADRNNWELIEGSKAPGKG
ncbi:MAG TPA: peptidase inhibitor family I36 protein, partial [Ardenticatenaceae bacterium]|nr:peptidase inhibitor family I36 protein [Ardenticatenaceae bacterium]